MGSHLGFLVGWASLLDYLLLPMVNVLIIRIYMESIFSDIPVWIWVITYVIIITAIDLKLKHDTSYFHHLFSRDIPYSCFHTAI
ncbi:hypothetical protein [Psychrobacillus sp. L3]|uniref:hypothetical protein n=1 Tax=Psychrobacillus sp. L3 TaxID=3236891 RepID=UPI0036F3214A